MRKETAYTSNGITKAGQWYIYTPWTRCLPSSVLSGIATSPQQTSSQSTNTTTRLLLLQLLIKVCLTPPPLHPPPLPLPPLPFSPPSNFLIPAPMLVPPHTTPAQSGLATCVEGPVVLTSPAPTTDHKASPSSVVSQRRPTSITQSPPLERRRGPSLRL
jgi:hypothetical protein